MANKKIEIEHNHIASRTNVCPKCKKGRLQTDKRRMTRKEFLCRREYFTKFTSWCPVCGHTMETEVLD